jgi:hypothetical protein
MADCSNSIPMRGASIITKSNEQKPLVRRELGPPERKRLALAYKRELRRSAEAWVERLVTLLDGLDGDPYLEPELSQSRGQSEREDQGISWSSPALEGEESEDLEPATARETGDQTGNWFAGSHDDLEPSLGASNGGNQLFWGTIGLYTDAEQACEDEGAQCDDEGINDDHLDCGDVPFANDQTGVQWAYGDWLK